MKNKPSLPQKIKYPNINSPQYLSKKKKQRIVIWTSISASIIALTAIVVPLVVLNPFSKNIDWNHQKVKSTIESETSIIDLNSLDDWINDVENKESLKNEWFTNSDLIAQLDFIVSISSGNNGSFTITPMIETKDGGKDKTNAIKGLTINSALNWNPTDTLANIATIQNISDDNSLQAWFDNANNLPIIKTWFTNGFRASNIDIEISGTSSYTLTPTIEMRSGFKNTVSVKPITGLSEIDQSWSPNEVKTEINQIDEIQDFDTLATWFEAPDNQTTIKSWFENPEAIDSVTLEVSGPGPYVLTPKITFDTGLIVFGGLTPINDFYFRTSVNWNHSEVRNDIANNPQIVDQETLAAWLENPINKPTINSWFTNHESASISVSLNENGPFAITPTVIMNAGFENSATPTPVSDITFDVAINWLPLNEINQSLADQGEVFDTQSFREWISNPNNQPIMKSWFTGSQYIDTVSIKATGEGPFMLEATVSLKAGYNNTVNTLPPIIDVTFNSNISIQAASSDVITQYIKSLIPRSLGAGMDGELKNILQDPVKMRQTIDTLLISSNKVVVESVATVVVYNSSKQTYALSLVFIAKDGYNVINSVPTVIITY